MQYRLALKIGAAYFAVACLTAVTHAWLEWIYYRDCKSTLFRSLAFSTSPYCSAVRSVVDTLADMPGRAFKTVLTVVIAPGLRAFVDGTGLQLLAGQ